MPDLPMFALFVISFYPWSVWTCLYCYVRRQNKGTVVIDRLNCFIKILRHFLCSNFGKQHRGVNANTLFRVAGSYPWLTEEIGPSCCQQGCQIFGNRKKTNPTGIYQWEAASHLSNQFEQIFGFICEHLKLIWYQLSSKIFNWIGSKNNWRSVN